MRQLMWILLGCLAGVPLQADDFRITAFARDGTLTTTNAFLNGVVTVERASTPAGPWVPEKTVFPSGRMAQATLTPSGAGGFFRALTVDFSGTEGSSIFSASDFVYLPLLVVRLDFPSETDGVSQFLGGQISSTTFDLLFSYSGDPDLPLQEALAQDFNAVIQGGAIYDVQRFASVHLNPLTRALLDPAPQGDALVRLNRMLLEDAYPQEVFQRRLLGFTNLVHSYGRLSTVAGSGRVQCPSCNNWQPAFEGGSATNAVLSSPHITMADRLGNLYIADKRAHAIRKVTPDGTIVTVAGTGIGGLGTTNPAPATSVALNNPNGLWVREDGSFYILDRENGLIRKVDTNGTMTLRVDNQGPIPGGRGLWVSPDESLLFYSAGSQLKRWDSTNGLAVYADSFIALDNLAVDPSNHVVVTDSGANRVYRIESDGTKTLIAGNGSSAGGGDGQLATETGLSAVRGIWFLPTGAFFLGTDIGSQVWYVDIDGYIHLFLNGDPSGVHAGDGAWFYNDPMTPKVSVVRQITMDYDGNLLVTENNPGYVRKVQLLRLDP